MDHQDKPAPPHKRASLLAIEGNATGDVLIAARWIGIFGQLCAVVTVHFGLGLALPLLPCLLCIGTSAVLNLHALYDLKNRRISTSRNFLYLAYDIFQLGLLLFLSGGIGNPFFMLLIGPVAMGATLLSLRQTAGLLVESILVTVLLAHFFIPLPLPPVTGAGPHSLILMGQFIAFSLTAAFAAAFAWRISDEKRMLRAAHDTVQNVIAQKRHLNSLGAQAAAAAHELGSPLSAIAIAAGELASDAGNASALSDDIQLIISQVERCKRILQKFGEPAQRGAPDYLHTPLPLVRLIHEIADNFGYENPGVLIRIENRMREVFIVRQDPEIVHSLGVFIQNAVQRAATQVDIICSEDDVTRMIEIRDDGPGFDAGTMSALGQPLRGTTSPQGGEGKRLGIFIAQNLLEEMGARTVYSNDIESGGAVVTIHWTKDRIE